jgi:hypothetical protein
LGARDEIQRLVVVSKTKDGKRRDEEISLVRFVPLTRDRRLEGKSLEGKTVEGKSVEGKSVEGKTVESPSAGLEPSRP